MKKKNKFYFCPAIAASLRAGTGGPIPLSVSSYYTEQHQSQVHTQYQEVVEKADGEELATARRKRRLIMNCCPSAVAAELDALDYDSLFESGRKRHYGLLEIPAIDVLLPIYHGVGEDSPERGAGHMPSTSLPIGGRGNPRRDFPPIPAWQQPGCLRIWNSWKREMCFISMC